MVSFFNHQIGNAQSWIPPTEENKPRRFSEFTMSPSHETRGIANQAYYQKYYEGRSPEHYSWLLTEIVRHGRPGNILDLGCGLGLFVEIAFMWGVDVQGCDGAEDGIKLALARNPKLNLSHTLLSNNLPFQDSSIDNVLLNQVIEHLPAPVFSKVLSECNRILRRGGVVFIFSPNKANRVEALKDPTHINPLYPSELRRLLTTAGFQVVAEPNGVRFASSIPFVSKIMRLLMKTSMNDWLSASANAYARKM